MLSQFQFKVWQQWPIAWQPAGGCMKNFWSLDSDLFWTHRVQQRLVLFMFCISVCLSANAFQEQLAGEEVETAINLHPKTPLDANRLWLPPQHRESAGLLLTAANLALEHPECGEVLYGGLNEYRTEREGMSFTIMCIKDARTTFNQIFFASDLSETEIQTPADEAASSAESEENAELERLRQLIQSSSGRQAPAPVQQQEQAIDTGPVPELF
jgi:hypothetical protein